MIETYEGFMEDLKANPDKYYVVGGKIRCDKDYWTFRICCPPRENGNLEWDKKIKEIDNIRKPVNDLINNEQANKWWEFWK